MTTYQTVNSGRKKEELTKLIDAGEVDVITFTSSSTVTNFVEIMGKDYVLSAPHQDCLYRSGDRGHGAKKPVFNVDIRQEEYTMDGLVQSLVNHIQNKSFERTGKENK